MKIPFFYALFFLFFFSQFTLSAKENPFLKAGEGYVTVHGGQIWYRILGEGDETPLLLMHGGPGGTSRSFYLFEKLAKDRPLILFDQLGTGRSGYHKDTSLLHVNEFVEQVWLLKNELKLNEFYLYGHSWGTALALEYYSAHPTGVKGIIFNSPYFSTAIWEADADTLISALPDAVQEGIKKGEESGDFSDEDYQNANTVYAANYMLRKKALRSPLDTIRAPGNSFIYNCMWGPTEFTATGTLKLYNILDKLKKVTVPTLFITGEFDEARPTTVHYFETLVPGSKTIIIKKAGHATMHDNLRANQKAIRDFLNKG